MTERVPQGFAWAERFLEALAALGKVTAAAEAAGVSPGTVYYLRNRNPTFAAGWQQALRPSEGKVPAPEVGEGIVPAEPASIAVPLDPGWRLRFLEALAETSNVRASAARAGIPVRTAYKTRRADPAFAARWRKALHEGYDHLEMELLGYLRDPQAGPKMDVASALRLLAAHRDAVARERALEDEEDEQEVLDSIDRFIDQMRERRLANEAILAGRDPKVLVDEGE